MPINYGANWSCLVVLGFTHLHFPKAGTPAVPCACPRGSPSPVSPGQQQDRVRLRWVRPGLRAGSGALSWGRHLKAPWPLVHFVFVNKNHRCICKKKHCCVGKKCPEVQRRGGAGGQDVLPSVRSSSHLPWSTGRLRGALPF